MAADNQITSLSNYMLYNFMDTPTDLYQRMRLNIDLNQELGIRIWSFPMRYQPVTLKDRSHVGKGWNRYYLRSFQIMLQATKGVVSGSPSFFLRAYGEKRRESSRGYSGYRTLSFSTESILKMEKGELRGRSMSRFAGAFRILRSRSSCIYWRIRPTGTEWGRSISESWRDDRTIDSPNPTVDDIPWTGHQRGR